MFVALPTDTFESVSIELDDEVYRTFLLAKGIKTVSSIRVRGRPWKVLNHAEGDSCTPIERSRMIFCVQDTIDLMQFKRKLQHPVIELDGSRLVERDGETNLVVSDDKDGETEFAVTKAEADALFKHKVDLPCPFLSVRDGATYVSEHKIMMPTWFTNELGRYLQHVQRAHCLTNSRRVALEGMEMRPLVLNSSFMDCKYMNGSHALFANLHPYSATCICGKLPVEDTASRTSKVTFKLMFCGSLSTGNFCARACTTDDDVIDPALPLVCQSGASCEIACDHRDGTPWRQRHHTVLQIGDSSSLKCFSTIAKALTMKVDDDDDDDASVRHEHMQTVLSNAIDLDYAALCEDSTPEQMANMDDVCLGVFASDKYTVVKGKTAFRFKKRDDTLSARQKQIENLMLRSHGHLYFS